MKKKTYAKEIVLWSAILFFAFVTALYGLGTLDTAKHTIWAEETTVDCSLADLTDWTAFSYDNLPDWTASEIHGETTWGYELNTTKEEAYSADSSLTSPDLTFSENEYTLKFQYYTRMRSATPNEVVFSFSEDGEEFIEVKTFSCTDTNDQFVEETVTFEGKPHNLRFSIHSYYAKDSDTDTAKRGVYFLPKLTLSVPNGDTVLSTDFDYVGLEEDKNTFVYNGASQQPVPVFHSEKYQEGVDFYFVSECRRLSDGQPTDSVHVGEYVLHIDIYDKANRTGYAEDFTYSITPATIELKKEDFTFYCNGKYAVILGVDLKDQSGRKIDKDEVTLEYGVRGTSEDFSEENVFACKKGYRLGVRVTSPDFNAYSAFPCEVTEEDCVSATCYFTADCSFDRTFRYTYDGETKTPFGEDFFSEPGKTASAPSFELRYFQGEEETETVCDAGEYTMVLSLLEKSYTFFIQIAPKTLTSCTYQGNDLVKYYDGTTDVYDSKTGRKKDFSEDITFLQAVTGDEVSLSDSSVHYARSTGKTYLITEKDASLTGADAENYTLASSFSVITAKKAEILPVQAVLVGDTDGEGQKITVADKTYTGDLSCAYLSDAESYLNRYLPVYGNHTLIRYKDVSFSFYKGNVGTQQLRVTLLNESLFDRYQEEIYTPVALYGTVLPAKLSVDTADLSFLKAESLTKTYDGTTEAFPLFIGLKVVSEPTGFPTYGTDFTVKTKSASYESAEQGTRIMTVEPEIICLTAEAENFFANYTLASFTVSGTVQPKTFEVYSRSIRIFVGESPASHILANAPATEYTYRIYDESTHAEVNYWDSVAGEYELRIRSSSSNYQMPEETGAYAPVQDGSYTVNLTVVQKEKARQQILFSDLNLEGGTDFVMLGGSSYTFTAYSVNEEKLPTDLPVEYTVSDPDHLAVFDRESLTLTAQKEKNGELTVTVSQKGDNYYFSAESVVLHIYVQDQAASVAIVAPDNLYAYSELPFLSANSFQVGDTAYSGTLLQAEGQLSQGENIYTYYMMPAGKINPVKKNFSVSGDYYEINGVTYVLADENYSVYNEYYTHIYRAVSLAENTAINENAYYEKEYVQTQDTFFQTGKTYYTAEYEEDETVQAGKTVPKGVYSEKIKGAFIRSLDTEFKSYPSMYYLVTFTEATTPWDEDEIYYERDENNNYYRTDDKKAQEGKQYFTVKESTEAFYEVGDPVPADKNYYYLGEDRYDLTEDTLFVENKKYYRIRYKASSVEAETAIDGIFYEVGESFVLTYDNSTSENKTYYTKEYVQKFFISAGDDTSSLYFEKDESGNYATTGDTVFSKDKTYYISVWTPVLYEGAEEALPADGSWCEKLPDEYVKTSDEKFIEGKSYYVLSSSSRYVLAVVTAGEEVKDLPYYEKKAYTSATYPSSTDSVKQNGKTYYVLSYEKTEFLVNGKLPDGVFYQKVPVYQKTEDTVFDEEKVYYTVSYEQTVCEKGGAVLGEYYRYDGTKYVKETERYFSYEETYYSPVFTPYNEKKEVNIAKQRTANTLYTYYIEKPALDEYQVGITYYEWVGNNFVPVDGTPEEDGTKRYMLFTGSRFEDGVTYYYYYQPFLGVIPVPVTLTATKPALTVYLKQEYSARSSSFDDFSSFVEKIELQGTIVPLEEGLSLLGTVDFVLPFERNVGAHEWDSEDWEVTFATENYTVQLADGTGTYTVEKEKLYIGIADENALQKFYGKDIHSTEEMINAVGIETSGTLSEEETLAIRSALFISVQAHALSDSGEYPLFISRKDEAEAEALFDSLVEKFDIVFQREFLTVLPIEIAVQYAGSHTYGDEDVQLDKPSNFTFTYRATLEKEEKERLEEEIFAGLKLKSKQEINSATDAGEYGITVLVVSDNQNMVVTTSDGIYTVKEASFPDSAFVLENQTFIFDKQYHSLSVRYDEEKWQGVTVTYNLTNCREIGSYAVTATVSLKNYKTKTLSATLFIKTRNIESSNKSKNAVSVTILDEDNTDGVSDKFNVVLKELTQTSDEETMNTLTTLLNEAKGENTYNIIKAFAIQVYDGKDKTDLSFSSYDITVMPSDLTYSENNILYGFTDGVFSPIEYTYKNGVYTFKLSGTEVDPLQYFVFIQDSTVVVTEYPSYTYWVIAGGIAIVIIALIGSVFYGLSSSRRKASRQRKRLIRHI